MFEFTRCRVIRAWKSSAHLLQGVYPLPDEVQESGPIYRKTLAAGKSWSFSYVAAMGETAAETQQLYDGLITRVEAELQSVRENWNTELQAVFTEGNSRYSGHMPILETTDKDILKVYHMGILGVIYFKRDNPHSVYGRAYDTLMPRFWHTVTFLWDYSLSSQVHALLDPDVMKKYLELWMGMDVHENFGSEYLTGGPVGPWYSVNDYAMSVTARDYLRWSGDLGWLHNTVASRGKSAPVHEYLHKYATNWQNFKQPSGLADYGGLLNLLECVSSYIHEVASLNAANVYNMRFGAEVADIIGSKPQAAKLRELAGILLQDLQKLYHEGQGSWYTGHPDGKLVAVAHCYDLLTVLNTIPDDLSALQKAEMTEFFKNELQTPTWMRALARGDADAMYSVRADHQWNGAYPAWPPQTVRGLYRIGEVDLAFNWLKGLAKTANQGPYGQAHFVEDFIEPEDGGARKVTQESPYINDWTCSSNGSWTATIIESIFGVNATLNTGINATPQFGPFDPDAKLRNLKYQGRSYCVDRNGLKVEH